MLKKVTSIAKLYIGIDIHKRIWKIQLVTNDFWGKSFTFPPCSDTLKTFVENNFKNYEVFVAYEAGCCGFKHQRAFKAFG